MSCLITGATGFIGSHLGRVLVRRGWDVAALSRATSNRSGLADPSVRWMVGDVTDPSSLREAVPGRSIIFHCAGLTKALAPEALLRVNLEGTHNLLEACAGLARPPERIVVLSSQAAAGPALPDGRPRAESDPLEPVSLYGRSKAEGERVCQQWMDRLPMVILRPVVVYGPRERDLYTVFRSLSRLPLLVEVGRRPVCFQAIHSRDLVEACLLSATVPAERVCGRAFFVGHREVWTSVAFGRAVGRAVGRRRIQILRVPGGMARGVAWLSEAWSRRRGKPGVLSLDKLRELAASPWLCSMDAFEEATGFRARIEASRGLAATAAWYRRHGWL